MESNKRSCKTIRQQNHKDCYVFPLPNIKINSKKALHMKLSTKFKSSFVEFLLLFVRFLHSSIFSREKKQYNKKRKPCNSFWSISTIHVAIENNRAIIQMHKVPVSVYLCMWMKQKSDSKIEIMEKNEKESFSFLFFVQLAK